MRTVPTAGVTAGVPTRLSTPRAAYRLLRSDPAAYLVAWLQWVGFHCAPLLTGWLLKLVLDRFLDGSTQVPWTLLAALVGVEAARWSLLVSAAVQWHGAWVGWQTVPRVNVLSSLATGRGPAAGRLPGSPGEAVSRFRDDVEDLALVLDVWLDVSGAVLSSLVAVWVMFTIDRVATVASIVPVGIALVASVWLGPRLRAWRRAAREATGAVTSFIGDTFGAVLAIKAAGAEPSIDARFVRLNVARARVARRDQIGTELIRSLGYGTGQVTVGIVLLFIAAAFRRGDVTVGDVGLFASYVTVVAGLPKWVGRLGAYHRQAEVSVDRLGELMPGGHAHPVVAPVTTHLRHGPPALPIPLPADGSFEDLQVRGLTVRHPSSGRGVEDMDLDVRHGELVVVTGSVGAGKSTLLRALLGLVARDAGEIRWNGSVVPEPEVFLVPPRVAYLPQVPRLFSESIADTILLGLPDEGLDEAVRLACLEDDIERMIDGTATVIGPRGLRLSGGQVQRTGAARALVRRPELLVVDDLSSALDVETEIQLWERFVTGGLRTALLVSHRPHVLDMADRVVRIEDGRVVEVRERRRPR